MPICEACGGHFAVLEHDNMCGKCLAKCGPPLQQFLNRKQHITRELNTAEKEIKELVDAMQRIGLNTVKIEIAWACVRNAADVVKWLPDMSLEEEREWKHEHKESQNNNAQ
jgi:hypothetical protein